VASFSIILCDVFVTFLTEVLLNEVVDRPIILDAFSISEPPIEVNTLVVLASEEALTQRTPNCSTHAALPEVVGVIDLKCLPYVETIL
jgi:hypothetical protein